MKEKLFDLRQAALDEVRKAVAEILPGCADCISRQAAIEEAVRLCDEELCDDCHIARKIVEKLTELPPAQPGWIPTSERLPEEDGQYLTTCKSFLAGYDYTDIFSFKSDIYDEYEPHRQEHKPGWLSYSDETGWFEMSNVTAWMPLPTPYRGGGQDGV